MPESLADFAGQFQTLLKAASPNQPVYLVGGAVRDLLLNRPVHDLDFSTLEPVKSLARGLAGDLQAALFALDEERGTYRVVESRPDGSRFTYDLAVLRGGDLPTDLLDRDFTINAMALDLRHPGKLIDPLGGAQDLRDKVLRVCTPHSFENDPVRVLRAVRQSVQFELRIEPVTLNLLKASVPGPGTCFTGTSAGRVNENSFRSTPGGGFAHSGSGGSPGIDFARTDRNEGCAAIPAAPAGCLGTHSLRGG